MPIYEYYCQKCNKEFELRRAISMADSHALCPSCGSESQKLVSAFASKVGFRLKTPSKRAFRKHENKVNIK